MQTDWSNVRQDKLSALLVPTFCGLAPPFLSAFDPDVCENIGNAASDAVAAAAAAADDAAYTAFTTADAAASAAASTAAFAASDAAVVVADVDASMDAAADVVYAYSAATEDNAINQDCRSFHVPEFDDGEYSFEIFQELWPNGAPEHAWSNWLWLRNWMLDQGGDWRVWTTWMQDRINGVLPDLKLELARIQAVRRKDFKDGPDAVNRRIAEVLEAREVEIQDILDRVFRHPAENELPYISGDVKPSKDGSIIFERAGSKAPMPEDAVPDEPFPYFRERLSRPFQLLRAPDAAQHFGAITLQLDRLEVLLGSDDAMDWIIAVQEFDLEVVRLLSEGVIPDDPLVRSLRRHLGRANEVLRARHPETAVEFEDVETTDEDTLDASPEKFEAARETLGDIADPSLTEELERVEEVLKADPADRFNGGFDSSVREHRRNWAFTRLKGIWGRIGLILSGKGSTLQTVGAYGSIFSALIPLFRLLFG